MTANFILSELQSVANSEKAKFLQGFFKTGKGQYAEGDVMLGINVPTVRNIVKANLNIPSKEIGTLLDSEYHEARLAGFLFLVEKFKKAKKNEADRKFIFDFYIANARRANNWDLVDVSCRDIVGEYLLDKDKSLLYRFAESENLWEQRIAIVSTWMFIKHGYFDDTLNLAEKLIDHKHDLIHKATGWMLREVGKKDKSVLVDFLEKHYLRLPRTALRYAIEHFDSAERERFMKRQDGDFL
ncbi:MAG: DNA alkylation repair protein [Prevotellaceae bacterium]|jgi:3-methyladenine DNA glycosylase AlkD|nr:DNA alkylation repair protein [Prevotellaceae bacterium]